jgi:hypothetical protein
LIIPTAVNSFMTICYPATKTEEHDRRIYSVFGHASNMIAAAVPVRVSAVAQSMDELKLFFTEQRTLLLSVSSASAFPGQPDETQARLRAMQTYERLLFGAAARAFAEDSARLHHVAIQAIVVRFHLNHWVRAQLHQNWRLLLDDFDALWRDATGPLLRTKAATGGIAVSLELSLQFLGYRCPISSCRRRGVPSPWCYACKIDTTGALIQPPSTASDQTAAAVLTRWKQQKNAAFQVWQKAGTASATTASTGPASIGAATAGSGYKAQLKAFLTANPSWSQPPPSASKASPSSLGTSTTGRLSKDEVLATLEHQQFRIKVPKAPVIETADGDTIEFAEESS